VPSVCQCLPDQVALASAPRTAGTAAATGHSGGSAAPAREASPVRERTAHRVLSRAGRSAFVRRDRPVGQVRSAGGSRNQCLLVIIAAYTGMRWGELAGLHRNNIDLETGRVHITAEGALHEVNGHLSLGHPKTAASVRTVTLPPFLTHLLTIDLAASTRPSVFTTLRGKTLRRSGFQRRLWAPAVNGGAHAGEYWTPAVPGMTFHSLRCTHKTWLIEDGIPEVAQARRLGHTMQSKIDDVYSQVAPSVEARLLEMLEARWQRSLDQYRSRHGQAPPCPSPPDTQGQGS
jgi:integrase